LFNSNNIITNSNIFNKKDDFANPRLSTISINSIIKNDCLNGYSKIESNYNSILDLINDGDISIINRNNKFKYNSEDLIYRNRLVNEKLNKILFQINEVHFRMNINTAEEHYVFSIENYLLDSLSKNKNNF